MVQQPEGDSRLVDRLERDRRIREFRCSPGYDVAAILGITLRRLNETQRGESVACTVTEAGWTLDAVLWDKDDHAIRADIDDDPLGLTRVKIVFSEK